MNKEQLIDSGSEINKISELSELCEKYEVWKNEVLQYVEENNLSVEKFKILLHIVNIPYGTREEKIEKYHSCIKKTLLLLQREETKRKKDPSENKLFRELGEDAFFYRCSKLIIYVYDKQGVINDADNFVKALNRDKESAGKEIKVYVEQEKELI